MKIGIRQKTLLLRGYRKKQISVPDVRYIFNFSGSEDGKQKAIGILENLEIRNLIEEKKSDFLKLWKLTSTGEKFIINHMNRKYKEVDKNEKNKKSKQPEGSRY